MDHQLNHNAERKRRKKSKKGGENAGSPSSADGSTTDLDTTTKDTDVVLTTLPNGKVAVRVVGENQSPEQVPGILSATPQAESLDAADMLRERFRGISAEVDSVMSALCLDVKCLLFSEHGMALNLSPAQLDAVQQILEKQLGSVRKARDIQQRMHQTSTTTSGPLK
mmetsp:Transcript_12209/g.19642  ORF Transcript_12209/g.19642 Transcript_12209/m.19642 type:complete len:167 (-) Transcript_12209:137-637(-)